ncbi:helix-turn-helix domain-containing protein [Tistrella bauzanensis]
MDQDLSPAPADGGMPAVTAEDATRDRLKMAARRLFSLHGIDAVSVRAIVTAAGMRNGASLHYYFGSKDALVRELVVDAAKRSDRARRLRLDAMEAAGGRAPRATWCG